MIYYSFYTSPIGKLTLLSDGTNLTGLYTEQQLPLKNFLQDKTISNLEVFDITKSCLNDYFNKKNPHFEKISLAPDGNKFRQTVWNILLSIEYGNLTTYGEIAKKVAKILGKEKMSAQAIGNAVGNNPISIIIPCHRVIGKDNNLTGYNGGIKTKIHLLQIEGHDISKFKIPK